MADINRLNAWSSNFIDEFDEMIRQHHLSLDNFCRVGTMLESAGLIYGLRVDSLYADVIRMSSGIQRQSLGQSFMDSTAATDLIADISVQSVQPIRRRRATCVTIVANGDAINAPLQMLEELKCPLDRMIGTDEISARSLFQQVLCSDRYAWTLQSNHKFWMDHNVVNGLDEFDELDEANVDLSVVNWIPLVADVVRPKLCGYQMANTPHDYFRYFESFTAVTLNRPDLQVNRQPVDLDVDVDLVPVSLNNFDPAPNIGIPLTTATSNQPDVEDNNQPTDAVDDPVPVSLSNFDPASLNNLEPTMPAIDVPLSTATLKQPDLEDNGVDMDLHFDIDVDPAPVNNEEQTLPEIGVSFDEDDRNALRRCSLLRPKTSIADDLRPLTSTPLSYSYRPVSDVPLSTDARHWTLPSIMHSSSEERATTRRRRRRKIAKKDEPVVLTQEPSDSVEQNFVSVDDPRTTSIRKSHQDKWKPTNLTMPSSMGHSTAVNFLPLMLGYGRQPTEETGSDAVIDTTADNDVEFQPDGLEMEDDMEPVLLTHAPSDSVQQNFVSVDDPRATSILNSHQDKWKPTNLTMPSRMGHSTAVNFLPLMLGYGREPTEETGSDSVINSVADDDVAFQPDEVDMEVDTEAVVAAPANTSIDTDIEMSIEGAPNVDHDYVIVPPMPQTPFPITRPNVDVKAITRRCLEIIRALEAAGGEPTFGEVYRQLEADGQARTPALVFSSILELANRQNFRLEKIGDTNDFVIKRI